MTLQTPGSEKILIVDDNPKNLELLAAAVEAPGYSFDLASSGKEALQLFEKNNYWLVLIDLLMPGVDGFETTRILRQKGFTHKIIAVSAISFRQDRQAAFEAGCDEFIPKPVNIGELTSKIEKYQAEFLRWKELEKDSDSVHYATNQAQVKLPSSIDPSDISILLVEEDSEQREVFGAQLKSAGFAVEYSENGAEAWRTLTSSDFKPNIVISNIHMSEIDGLGLLAMIKRESPSILFFLYSPQFDADTIQLAAKEGVDCILVEDKFKDTILELISSELSKSKNNQTIIKSALQQVRQAHDQLVRPGCDDPCDFCDIAYASLLEVGGDIASCRRFNLEGRCGVVLIDVAGHDFVSSYLSAVFWGILSSHWNDYQQPQDLAALLNEELFKLGYHNSHICLTAILWDPIRRKLSVTLAGNPGGMLIKKSITGETVLIELSGGGMVIGLLPENTQMIHQEFELTEECTFIFHSDGLTHEQLKSALNRLAVPESVPMSQVTSQQLVEQLLAQHRQEDDMIVVKLNIPPDNPEPSNRISIKSDFESVDQACSWLESKLFQKMLPKGQELFNIMLSVREAVLNAVEHGNRSDCSKFVDLSYQLKRDQLKIRISDEGPGFSLHDQLRELKIVDSSRIGKRGLPMMQSFTDAVNVNGSTVELIFNKQ